jgi:hypothetical protein
MSVVVERSTPNTMNCSKTSDDAANKQNQNTKKASKGRRRSGMTAGIVDAFTTAVTCSIGVGWALTR